MNIFIFCKKLLEINHILPEGRRFDGIYRMYVSRGRLESIEVFANSLTPIIEFQVSPFSIWFKTKDGFTTIDKQDLEDITVLCLSYQHQQNFPVLDLISKRLVNEGVFLS